MDYDSMTVAQLKELADKHGVKYNTKTRKVDLIRAIDDATTIVAGVGTLAGRNSLEDQGWKPLGYTTEGDVFVGVSRELSDDLVSGLRRAYEQVTRDRINRKRNRVSTERKIIRTLRSSASKYYGVGGRGLGAKHYNGMLTYTTGGPVTASKRVVPGTLKLRAAIGARAHDPNPNVPIRAAIVGRGLTGAYGR